jgi:hypothetical protein
MKISHEFIPYEQALELKELGFDEREECLAYYNTNPRHTKPAFDMVKPYEHEFCLPVPLYQHAFRWFREKHGLYSAVNVDQTMEPKFAYCISKYWTDALSWGWDTIIFNSDLYYNYEEAELDCLKKLIEIVKQN